MAITMGKSFAVFPIDVPGAIEAFAVDGSPADTVMLGLNAPIWSFDENDEEEGAEAADGEKKNGGETDGEEEAEAGGGGYSRALRRLTSESGGGSGKRTLKHAASFSAAVEEALLGDLSLRDRDSGTVVAVEGAAAAAATAASSSSSPSSFFYPHSRFDLVASGTNKGDNLGFHAWYSGTVGAAREGALSALPSLAFSLDDHSTSFFSFFFFFLSFRGALSFLSRGDLSSHSEMGFSGESQRESARERTWLRRRRPPPLFLLLRERWKTHSPFFSSPFNRNKTGAKLVEDFDYCSEFAAGIVSAVLQLGARHRRALMGHVLNVNFPRKSKCLRIHAEGGNNGGSSPSPSSSSSSYPPDRMRVIALTTQGGHCWRPGFDERYARVEKAGAKEKDGENGNGNNELDEDSVVSPRAAAVAGDRASELTTRYFKNIGGGMWEDRETAGTDSWAVAKGMASVVVLGLKQHALTRGEKAHVRELEEGERATEAGKEVVEVAARALGCRAVLLP